jgi:hypothetical protein
MSAPSSYQASPYDGRTEADPVTVDLLPIITEWAEGHRPTRHREGTFAARVASKCAGCPAWITPGDIVQYGIDDQLEHAECPDDLDTIPAQGVCDGCYLTRAVNGSCGCA